MHAKSVERRNDLGPIHSRTAIKERWVVRKSNAFSSHSPGIARIRAGRTALIQPTLLYSGLGESCRCGIFSGRPHFSIMTSKCAPPERIRMKVVRNKINTPETKRSVFHPSHSVTRITPRPVLAGLKISKGPYLILIYAGKSK
jgi:hypothetical protein